MSNYRRPYVESSVFIAFIKGEMRGEHDCATVFESIRRQAESGRFMLFTSALTIAEVCKKRTGDGLTAQEAIDLTPYFREPYIRLIEVDRDIAERANQLCREHLRERHERPALRPNDAAHLACAERANSDYLLSYDHHLMGQSHSSLIVEWPEQMVDVQSPAPSNMPVTTSMFDFPPN